jgi:hypothetical protein
MAGTLDEKVAEEEAGLTASLNREDNKTSLGRRLYHLSTLAPLAYLSYAVTGISGVLFTTFLTLGGIVKRRRMGKGFSGEKTMKDLKAGSLFSHLVYALYTGVNLVGNPVLRTLALNPLSYAAFNGAYLGYLYFRDTILERVGGYKATMDILYGRGKMYLKEVWEKELKPNWMKLNLKTLVFLPVNYFNVNKVKELYQQVFVGSLIDFAYGVFTTKAKPAYA